MNFNCSDSAPLVYYLETARKDIRLISESEMQRAVELGW